MAVFARYPRLGTVKTRLLGVLKPQECLDLHLSLLLDTLERVSTIPGSTVWLYLSDCSPDEMASFCTSSHISEKVQVRRQDGRDLGERLCNGLEQMLQTCRPVILLGSDSPTLPLNYLRKAIRILRQSPVVLGPTEDGGYYLLGLQDFRVDLFQAIAWGTSAVLQQTLQNLRGQNPVLLPIWYDVDVPDDLTRLKRDLSRSFEGYPLRTAHLLQELVN
ncbi:MAG: TIGR04282 family arsenosugar biosynthesis glycosyltransferase [Acidobacteria bacterium]|nr:TIGR04282 family arsenosugar biosynthesis glycosyltransferase [Acidobacteriota bacterium]